MEVFVKPLTVKQQTYEEARNNAQFDTDTWVIKDADPEVEGDYLLVKNPEQVKSADPISPGPKVTPDQWADTGESDIRYQRQKDSKGSAQPLADGKVLLKGLQNPDFTTAVHEMMHAMEMTEFSPLTDAEVATLKRWAGSKTEGRKAMEVKPSEKLARGWERYLAEGKAPLPSLQELFDKIAKWMLDTYKSLQNRKLDVDISPEVRAIFDKIAARMEAPAAIVLPGGATMSTDDGSALPPAIPPNAEAPAGMSPEDEMAGRLRAALETPPARPPVPQVIPDPEPSTTPTGEEWNPEGLFSLQERRSLEEADARNLDISGWVQAKRTFGDLWNSVVAQPRGAGERFLDKLVSAGDIDRVLTDPEIAMLTHEGLVRKQAVSNAFEKLTEALANDSSDALVEELQRALQDSVARYQTLQNIAAGARTASGRSLNAWKYALRNDFSYATLQSRTLANLNAVRKTNGKEPLAELPASEQAAVEKFAKEAQAMQEELQRLREAAAAANPEAYMARIAEQDALIEELIAERKAAAKNTKVQDVTKRIMVDRVRKAAAEARARLKAANEIIDDGVRYQSANEDNDPRWYDRVLVMAEVLIAEPAMSAARFADLVRQRFGDAYVGAAQLLRKDAERSLRKLLNEVAGTNVPTPAEVKEKLSADEELTRQDIYDLARAHVFEGARNFEVMKRVFADLSPIFKDLTHERLTQIFTGYGDTEKMSPTEEAVALRAARSLELVQKQIDDLEASGAMKRTGRSKDDPSPELRALRKKRDDLAKAIGYVPVDPDTQLSSAQTAARKRMENEIQELDDAIKSGIPRVRVRRGVEYTEDMKVLRDKLASLRQSYNQVFGQERTPQERLRLAMADLDRRIAKERELINKGILAESKTELPKLDSPELTARREELKRLREQKLDVYDALHPNERALAQAMKDAQEAVERRQKVLEKGLTTTKAKAERGEGVTPTEDLISLWEAADAMDILIREMRKNRPLTPEQQQRKLDNAYKTAVQTREDLLKRIADGVLIAPARAAAPVEDRTRAVREENSALRQQLLQMAKDAGVGPFSQDAREAKRIASIEARIAELRRKREAGDFSKRKQTPPVTSQKIMELELVLDRERRLFDEARAREAFKTLGWVKRQMEIAMAAWHARQMFNLSGDFGIFGRQLGKTQTYVLWEDLKSLIRRKRAGEAVDFKNGTIIGKTLSAGLQAFLSPNNQERIYSEMATNPRYAFHKANGFDLTSPHETSYEMSSAGQVRVNPMVMFNNRVIAAILLARGAVKTAAATTVALATGAPIWKPIVTGIGDTLFAAGLGVGGALFARRVEAAQQTMLNVARWNILEAALLIPENATAETQRTITEGVMTLTGKIAGKKGLSKWIKDNAYTIGLFLQFPQYKWTNLQSVLMAPVLAAKAITGRTNAQEAKALSVLLGHMWIGTSAKILVMAALLGVWDEEDEESTYGVVLNPDNPNFGQVKLGKTYINFAAGWSNWLVDFARFTSDTKLDPYALREGLEREQEKTDFDRSQLMGRFLEKQLQANLRTAYQAFVQREFRKGGDLEKMDALNQADLLLGEIVMNLTYQQAKEVIEKNDPATAAALLGLLMTGQDINMRETNAEKAEREAKERERYTVEPK
jgi:hypothetical protein